MNFSARRPREAHGLRGFTLIELIVVILVLGILAAVAVIGYGQLTERAQGAAAAANLKQIATAVVAHHTAQDEVQLSRAQFLRALQGEVSVDVVDGLSLAPAWTLYGANDAPAAEGDFAVGFDTGEGSPATNNGGSRAAVVTHTGSGSYARVIVYGAADTSGLDGATGAVPEGTTPGDVLGDPALVGDDDTPSPGAGGDTDAPAGPGEMEVLLEAYNYSTADAISWGEPSNEMVYATVVAPVGTDPSDAGLSFTCVPSSPVPGAGVKTYLEIDVLPDGRVNFVVAWSGNDLNVAATGRVYECTYTAHSADRTLLASRTLSDAVDGEPTTTPGFEMPGEGGETEVPEVNDSGYDQVKVTAADASDWDTFGTSVAIDGNTMITSAPLDDNERGQDAGAVYIYTRSGGDWALQQKVIAPAPPAVNSWQSFGHLVALDGNTAVVTDNVNGTYYVYVRSGSTWTQQAAVAAPEVQGGFFATDLALSGDTFVVGAELDGSSVYGAPGVAAVFHRTGSTWSQQAELRAVKPTTFGYFGASVDIDGDTIAVGAPSYAGLPDNDSVTIFTRSGNAWTPAATLAPDAAYYGTDLALDGGTLAVLASDQNMEGKPNSLYVYTGAGSTWAIQDVIEAKMAGETATLRHVDISGDTIVAGFYYSYWSNQPPRVSVYDRSGTDWSFTTSLWPIPNQGQDNFSEYGVSIDGNSIAVGAEADNERATGAGAVHVFTPQS